MFVSIPHSRPTITDLDLAAIHDQMKSGLLACGRRTAEFETLIANRHGLENVVCVNSGREALRNVFQMLQIGIDDEVLISTYVCPSVLSSVLQVGATPVFYDIDETWRPSIKSIESKLSAKSRAIVVVHIFGIDGSSSDLNNLPLHVIDDLCQAYGLVPKFASREAAFFSFNATKCITTGEGGAFFVCPDLAANNCNTSAKLSDFQGALGVSQDFQYDKFLMRRREIAQFFLTELPPAMLENTYLIQNDTCWFRFPVVLASDFSKFSSTMASHGISVRRGVDSLLHQIGPEHESLKTSEKMFQRTASLPIYPSLTDSEVELIVDTAKQIMNL